MSIHNVAPLIEHDIPVGGQWRQGGGTLMSTLR